MRLKISAALAFIMIWFSSCQKDVSEETGVIPDSITATTGGTTSGATNSGTCKDCAYFPQCSGSVYTFRDTSAAYPAGKDSTYRYTYIKDTVLESKTYQKISVSGQINYLNCTSGVTTAIAINGTTTGGVTIPYLKSTALKANEAVGASWADILTVSGQAITYTYTIVSKGQPRTVAGHVYTDVIDVHEETTEDVPGVGTLSAGESEYYFARGTGLIESISSYSGSVILHHVLISATIP